MKPSIVEYALAFGFVTYGVVLLGILLLTTKGCLL